MKKTITILLSLFFISAQAVKAEIGIGITGAVHFFDVSGTETTRTSNEKNTGSHSDEAMVPELFIESITENGGAFGIAYIPTANMGSKSRSDSNSDGDTGSYKAEAELKNVIQIYGDIPTPLDVASYPIYAKVGIQHATISTLESLNSGSTYPDKDVLGFLLGIGTKGNLAFGDNLYYKAEATYVEFQEYSAGVVGGFGNRVEADLEYIAVKFSIGKLF